MQTSWVTPEPTSCCVELNCAAFRGNTRARFNIVSLMANCAVSLTSVATKHA